MDEQTFEDYKSKYLDIYDKTKSKNDEEKESLIEEIDFELELIQRDDINVAYILKLLSDLQRGEDETQQADYQQKKASILGLLDKEAQLRSKRDLIEKFIDTRMLTTAPEEKVEKVFQDFWNQERDEAVRQLCTEENLKVEAVKQMIANYKFSGKEPLRETVLSACNENPKLLERKKSLSESYRNYSISSTSLMMLLVSLKRKNRPPARIRERLLNPSILGDFELQFPKNWGLGGGISGWFASRILFMQEAY